MYDLLLVHAVNVRNWDLWYALPAIIAVSLVYAATRHERMLPILVHAGRVALWLVCFMFIIFLALEVVAWFV